MKKHILSVFIAILLVSLFPQYSLAVTIPLSVPNNKYGIHVIDENDLENAASLVNSSGGDWGYVTFVIPENERKIDKWNSIFDKLRRLHLIPIIRLATISEGDYWRKPLPEDASDWTDFLSQLRWVTKNRYIILFNEPNHAGEWGGSLDPEEYSQVIASFSSKLKESSDNFFILPAGMDASAPNSRETMDEASYLKAVVRFLPNFGDYIDGWTSHSYPNPAFSGKPTDRGRGTLETFEWEKNFLEELGINRHLPIFITETGWTHAEGELYESRYHSADTVAEYIQTASQTIWMANDIVAITPFLINYQAYPFSHFSWQKLGGDGTFYPQFDMYKSLEKIAGEPELVIYPTSTPSPTQTPFYSWSF